MSNVIFFCLGTRPLSGHYITSETGYDDTGKQRQFGALSLFGHRTLIRLRQKRPRSSASPSSSLIVIYDKQRARVGRKSVRRSLGQSSGGHRPENCPMRKEGGASAAQRWPPSLVRPLFFTRSPPLQISRRGRKKGRAHLTSRISSSKGDLPAGWTQCYIREPNQALHTRTLSGQRRACGACNASPLDSPLLPPYVEGVSGGGSALQNQVFCPPLSVPSPVIVAAAASPSPSSTVRLACSKIRDWMDALRSFRSPSRQISPTSGLLVSASPFSRAPTHHPGQRQIDRRRRLREEEVYLRRLME